MNVIIRKLKHQEQAYFAYTKSIFGRGTYFVYFQDNIGGAVVLHNFIEMLRALYLPSQVQVGIAEKTFSFQDEALRDLFKAEAI